MCVWLPSNWICTDSVRPVLSLCSICLQLLSVSCQLVWLRPINAMLMPVEKRRDEFVVFITVPRYLISPATTTTTTDPFNKWDSHLPAAVASSWQLTTTVCLKFVHQCNKLATSVTNWTDNLWAFSMQIIGYFSVILLHLNRRYFLFFFFFRHANTRISSALCSSVGVEVSTASTAAIEAQQQLLLATTCDNFCLISLYEYHSLWRGEGGRIKINLVYDCSV